tara:strand:+ start:3062 stop:3562 length:501 start_codon:yes stop_codon:yes gene_type:complete
METSIKDYINNVLREKRDEFGGMAVCPFAGPELDSNKLMIDVIGDKNLEQLMIEFAESDYESALLALEEDLSDEETKSFQIFVNKLLKQNGLREYKSICFNPNDKVSVNGFNPRAMAPCFLINIADKKVLNKAHKSLRKTEYYDKLSKEYRRFLQLDEKDKKTRSR